MKQQLVQAAQSALQHAYAPYSGYRVGAAVLADGRTFTGANIENASYGLTICAERSAVFAAVSSGVRRIEAIAIATEQGSPSPCGACRQVLREFGHDFPVFLAAGDGTVRETTLQALLPDSFGPDFLLKEDRR